MYVRKLQCYHYLGIIFLIKTIISDFLFVVINTITRLKFSNIATLPVLMLLPCMTSSSFILRLFIGWFSHKYQNFSRTNVWIWLLCFKYLMYFILLVFWFRCYESNSEIWHIFQIHITKKKLLYTDPQLLRKCKFLNSNHGGQLTATHSIVCYYIVCLIIQPLRTSCPIPWIFYRIRRRHCCAYPDIFGEGGWENLANVQGTRERAEASQKQSEALERWRTIPTPLTLRGEPLAKFCSHPSTTHIGNQEGEWPMVQRLAYQVSLGEGGC